MKIAKTLILVSYFCSFAVIGYAQKSATDSLELLLSKYIPNDTTKVNLLNKLTYAIYPQDSVKAMQYAKRSTELSEKLHYSSGTIESFLILGFYHKSAYSDQAIRYYKKALQIAEREENKTEKAKCYNAIGIYYFEHEKNDSAIEYFQKAISEAKQISYTTETAKYLQRLAAVYAKQSKYEQAIASNKQSLKILEQLNEKYLCSVCLNNIGKLYERLGNRAAALDSYHKSIKFRETLKDTVIVIGTHYSISKLYFSQSDHTNALIFLQKALALAQETNNKHEIASCYLRIGNLFNATKNLEAIDYLTKAYSIQEEISENESLPITLNRIGDFYVTQNNYHKALQTYEKALVMAKELKRKPLISTLLYKMAEIFYQQKNQAMALRYSLQSLAIAKDVNMRENQKNNHFLLSEIYSVTNNYKEAYLNHKSYKTLSDSDFNELNVKEITEIQLNFRFEQEKQAIELENLKRDALYKAEARIQKTIIISLITISLLGIIFTIFILVLYRNKNRLNILLRQQKAEIQELNAEYVAVNEELKIVNDDLSRTKRIIEERENLLIHITDNIPVSISLINNNLEYIFSNTKYAEMYSSTKSELQDKNVRDLFDTSHYLYIYPNILRALNGEAVSFEKILKPAVGKNKVIDVQYIPYIENDCIIGMLVCSTDITQRKEAELALKEIEEQKAQLMADEIERMNKEIEANQKSMAAAALKLIQNSERDAQTIDRLTEIEKNANKENKQSINALITDYKRKSYNTNWREFEILFEKVHFRFYENLNAQYPMLSPNERKLCAFLRLNMSSKDIAQITFQSEDALKKSRLRLRQKFGLDRETNLTSFMQSF